MQMNFCNSYLYMFIVMAMMLTASGKDIVTLTVYEDSMVGDPFAEGNNEVDFELKKIGQVIVDDQYLSLFFQGIFKEEIKEKGLTHPFAGKPIYLQMQVGREKNHKLIQLNLGYKGGFYIINRDSKSGKFISYHPSNNEFYARMMQKYLICHIKGLVSNNEKKVR